MIRWIICMRSMSVVMGVCLLAACAPVNENTPGKVFLRGDDEVVVVGPKEHGREAYPTKRMIEQAEEACPNARFVNARPSLNEPSSFDYLFNC